jgi:putative oxidoreductase
MLSRLISLFNSLAVTLQPLAALLTRLVIGWTFVGTGSGKWKNFDHTVEFFRSIGIPAPSANAAFIATLELVGGICLILGLGTRIVAALLSCTMVVAILTADWADFKGAFGGGQKDLLDVTPVPFLLFLLWLIAFGAGAISVDRWLANRKASGAGK